MSKLVDVLSKEVYCNSKASLRGSAGEVRSRWAVFRNFLKKKAVLTPIGSHFAHIQKHLKVINF